MHFFSQYSSTILAMMCIEKFFALYFPLKTRSICTVRTAKWVTGITAVCLAIVNSPLLVIMKEVTISHVTDCYSDKYPIFLKIDSVIYSYAPFIIMAITNSAIIYKFIKAKMANRSAGTESTNQALSKNAFKGTVMLITVSVMFFLLTGPVAIVYNVVNVAPPYVQITVVLMRYLNHSINGVLYIISGSRFRAELMKTFPFRLCGKQRDLNHSNSTVNSTTISSVSSTASPT